MANIVAISTVDSWFLREIPSFSKFNAQLTTKMNTLISNQVLINDALEELLQGASGGAEQAKIPFAHSAAPTGWTRDATFTTDNILRVTDGATLPPGVGATATGGAMGGSWTISGIAAANESAHTHPMNHSHSGTTGNSNQDLRHQHSIAGEAITVSQMPSHAHSYTFFSQEASSNNPHIASNDILGSYDPAGAGTSAEGGGQPHSHGGTTGGVNTAPYGPSIDITAHQHNWSTSLTQNTTAGTAHNHAMSHDAGWRPKYLNIIICKKD